MSGPISRVPEYEEIVDCKGKVGYDILYKRTIAGIEYLCYVDSADDEEVCFLAAP